MDKHIRNGNWINQLKGMDKTRLNSLFEYQDDLYKDVNYYLRHGTFSEDSIQASVHGEKQYAKIIEGKIKDIKSLINKSTTDVELVLYRGVPGSKNIRVGGIEGDKALLSTSTDFEEAKLYTDSTKTMWEILYPKESKGLPVTQALEENSLTSLHSECEILLPPGFRGKVIDIYKKEGYTIIRLRP